MFFKLYFHPSHADGNLKQKINENMKTTSRKCVFVIVNINIWLNKKYIYNRKVP